MVTDKKVVGKIKKKMWFEILAPKIFRNTPLGETLTTDKEKIMGKEIKASLANITGDMKRQSTIMKFKVTELKGDKALTSIIGYSILLTHIKRMVRKGRERIDSSFICKTKDEKPVRIKFVFITRSLTKNSVLTSLRKVGKDILTTSIKEMPFSNLINDVITYKLQRSLKEQLKKIFPLKVCEIRHISLITEKKELKEKVSEKKTEKKEVEEKVETKTVEKEMPKEEKREATEVEKEEKTKEKIKTETVKEVEEKVETETVEKEIPKEENRETETVEEEKITKELDQNAKTDN